jgi:hypothetical protein
MKKTAQSIVEKHKSDWVKIRSEARAKEFEELLDTEPDSEYSDVYRQVINILRK